MAEREWMALRDLLLQRAGADPGRVAFVHDGQALTYAELSERASGRAGALRAMGVGHGDRIALAISAGLPFVETFWGLQLIGAVPCAFNPAVPSETLARRVARVRPHLVLTDASAAEMRAGPARLNEPDIGPEDLAFLQLTSGTSGVPRASMIRHRNVFAYLAGYAGRLEYDDVAVSWVPPWHDLGLVDFVIGSVYQGVTCHIVTPAIKTIPEWLATISRVGGTWSAAPDFAFRLAVRMVDPATVDLSALRFMTSGGEPVRWSSIEAFETHFSAPGVVVPGYGLGEVTLGVSTHFPGEHIPVDDRGNVSCGRPRLGIEVRTGTSAEDPRPILVRGEAVFAGYFDAPEETSRILQDGWLHTGDSGYQDAQGRLFVLGRRAGMIKRAGAVISPRELEEAAERTEGVRLAAATGIEEAQGDVRIIVAVEADTSAERSPDRIAGEVSREIVRALGFAPAGVRVLPRRSIPRTENGKVRYASLRALLEDGSLPTGS